MKKRYLALLPAMAALAPLQSSADVKLEATLDQVAKKVDTDGTYLQLNKFDADLKVIEEYAVLGLGWLQKAEPNVPKEIDIPKLIKILGINDMKAMASSAKKVDGSWNNRSYVWTGGSARGIFSLYGGQKDKFAVTDFAPETTDIAVQARVDLRQVTAIFMELMKQFDEEEQANEMLHEKLPELGGMTVAQLLSKVNARLSVAIDIDRENNRLQPEEGVDLPGTEAVARLDGAAWAWAVFGDKLIKESGLPWDVNVVGKVTTYTLPDNMKEGMMGYSPIIRVDLAKNMIWVATKPSVLTAAMGGGIKLKDGAAFKKTMASLPKSGNSMAYISKDLLNELVGQYRQAGKNGLLNDPDFVPAKPLVEKLIKDLTTSESGVAAVLDLDEDGVNTVLRAPFPVKNYTEQLTPILSQGMMSFFMMRAMVNQNF